MTTKLAGSLTLLALTLISGCSAGLSPSTQSSSTNSTATATTPSTPTPNLPAKSPITTPRIMFIGDDILAGLVTQAQNPLWTCPDCFSQATSARASAGLPQALMATPTPDLAIILTGSYDVDNPAWDNACGPTTPSTCDNILAMAERLQEAGIPYIICSIPFWQPGTLSDSLAPPGGVQFVQASEDLFDHDFSESLAESEPEAGYLDFADALPAAMISSNGIDPNAQGYQVMIQMIQAKAQVMHVGYLR